MTSETVPENLRNLLKDSGRVALAFSGGCDSSYLLYALKESGADFSVYTVRSQFQTSEEIKDAVESARRIGVCMEIIDVDILSYPEIKQNPKDRCYHCKHAIFDAIKKRAESDGISVVIDGTNASDDPNSRPGMKALVEEGIVSPLRLCGISKSDVRVYSRRANLPTWHMPSNSCLATRIIGIPITQELLSKTEECERSIRSLGFTEFRVRTDGQSAVFETTEQERESLSSKMNEAEEILLKYYPSVSHSVRKQQI